MSNYWQKRFELLEDAQNRKGVEFMQDVERIYGKAIKETEKEISEWYRRFANNEGITLTEAKRLLNSRELKEFRMTVEEYIEKGKTLNISDTWAKELERASAKVHVSRLEALKVQMQQQVETLTAYKADEIDKLMKDIYTDSYYKTAFEVQKGIKVGWEVHRLDVDAVNKTLAKPWAADGSNFSQRIWGKHRPELIKRLHDGLSINLAQGKDVNKLIEQIEYEFGVDKSKAARLVYTEKAYFQSLAQLDSFKELGVEEFEVCATLDNRTSEICQTMDGKHFPLKEFQVGVTAPPFHCYCRTATCPYFDDEFTIDETRAARDSDGKYYNVPSNMNYKEWKETFVDADGEEFKKKVDKYGITVFARPLAEAVIQNAVSNIAGVVFNMGTAKSVREATDEVMKHVDGSVSFKGIKNIDSLNELNGTLDYLYEKYDLKNLEEIKAKSTKGGTWASAHFSALYPRNKFMNNPVEEVKNSTIGWISSRKNAIKKYEEAIETWSKQLDDEKFKSDTYYIDRIKKSIKDFKKAIKELEDDLKYPRHNVVYAGQEVRSVITHEFGHVISDQKIGKINGKMANPAFEKFDTDNELYMKTKMVESVFKKAKSNGDIYKISKYASTNSDEFFAECFTMYDLKIEELPDYIVEMIERVIE